MARLRGTNRRPDQEPGVEFEPASIDELAAPGWLSPEARAEWERIVPALAEEVPELVTKFDTPAFGLMLEHFTIARAARRALRKGRGTIVLAKDPERAGTQRKHPAWQVFREASASFLTLAREFGLTPSSRAGLHLGWMGGEGTGDADEDDAVWSATG